MRPLQFRYSLNYYDFIETVKSEFETWLRYELRHGGASEVRIDYKVSELLVRYLPSSPRQLLELAMQCEAMLDVSIEDEIFGEQAPDAYEALRIAIARSVANELHLIWENLKLEDGVRRADHLFPFSPEDDGLGDLRNAA